MKAMIVPGVCVILALGACDSSTGGQSPVPYDSTKRISPSGVANFSFRSFTEDGEKKEVSGATCMMTGDGFRSQFMTPAVLTAPVFGPETQPVSITCDFQGETKTKTLNPYNKSQAKANKSLISLKSATSITGAVVAAAKIGTAMAPRDQSRDVYEYRDGAVTFGKK